MPTQVTNYQCPSCTGPLHFAAGSGKLECEFCGSAFEVAEIEALYAEKEKAAREAAKQSSQGSDEGSWDLSSAGSDWGSEADNMRSYSCPSCGASLICDATTAATSCPYCGNPSVVPGQFGGAKKPDYIVPFKLTKEDAVAALKKHYKGKALLPKAFAAGNHVEEIKGVYVPFWLFDGAADADVRFAASTSISHREGKYEVTTTSHYDVHRAGTVSFEKIPVDASSKMPDDYMDSIEPYDYTELKPFSTAFMPGFLADKYDVAASESTQRADVRAANTAVQCMEDTVTGYSACSIVHKDVTLQRGKVSYALLPVWMLSTRWKGKSYLFAINGQTGKPVGDLPVSWGKFWAWFGGITVPLTIILSLIFGN